MKAKIIKDLPNFPEDVIKQFLIPYAKKLGWPPGNTKKDPSNRWKYILRLNDLTYWREIKWNKKSLKLSPYKLLTKDFKIVTDLIQANVMGQMTDISSCMPDSKERFDYICTYLKQNGVYPKTVAIEQLGKKFRIIDGCHRMAAYFYLFGWFKIKDDKKPCLSVMEEQEYWVAEK